MLLRYSILEQNQASEANSSASVKAVDSVTRQ